MQESAVVLEAAPPKEVADEPKPRPTCSEKHRATLKHVAASGLLAFIGTGVLSLLHFAITDQHDFTLIFGSFGASAVLLYGAPSVPFSQPRNCVGGHLVSCFVGVACHELFSVPLGSPWLSVPLGASFALMAMQLTGTVHPPAGGTVLIAVLGSQRLHAMGFGLLLPTLIGAVLLVAVAMLNNVVPGRKKYPQRWL